MTTTLALICFALGAALSFVQSAKKTDPEAKPLTEADFQAYLAKRGLL